MPVSIKTLKQFALKVHNFAYGTEWDDEDIVSAMAFDEIIEKMMKDEKKLEEQVKKLEKDLIQQKKISFWRMAEAYAGYDKNTCLHDDDWCNEVKEAMEEYYDNEKDLGSIDELLKEYKDWIGYYPSTETEEKDEGGFDHWAFEKADTENNVNYFNELKAKGYENAMKSHRKMTSCFDWKNFDAWVKEEDKEWWKDCGYNSFEEGIVGEYGDQSEQAKKYGFGVFKPKIDLPSPFLPYPREKFEGEFNDFYENEEEEQKAIIEYFKLNKPRSIEAVKKFVDTNDVKGNDIIEVLKGLKPEAIKVAYWGYEEITKAYAQEDFKKRIKVIGSVLNSKGGIDMMRLSFYLFAWDLQHSPMAVKGAKSLVEFYWGGIGEWLA